MDVNWNLVCGWRHTNFEAVVLIILILYPCCFSMLFFSSAPSFKIHGTLCLQAAPGPGWTDCTVYREDLEPVEGGSSNAVVGGDCERGATSCWCQRPSGGGLPKQVKFPSELLCCPHFCVHASYVSIRLSLCFRRKQRYQSAPRNIHRHVLLSEIKEATSSLPLVRNIQQSHFTTIHRSQSTPSCDGCQQD